MPRCAERVLTNRGSTRSERTMSSRVPKPLQPLTPLELTSLSKLLATYEDLWKVASDVRTAHSTPAECPVAVAISASASFTLPVIGGNHSDETDSDYSSEDDDGNSFYSDQDEDDDDCGIVFTTDESETYDFGMDSFCLNGDDRGSESADDVGEGRDLSRRRHNPLLGPTPPVSTRSSSMCSSASGDSAESATRRVQFAKEPVLVAVTYSCEDYDRRYGTPRFSSTELAAAKEEVQRYVETEMYVHPTYHRATHPGCDKGVWC